MNNKQKALIQKKYAQGKKKYIVKTTILYSLLMTACMTISDYVSGKVVTVVPGYPVHISFHSTFFISLLVYIVLSPIAGYFTAKRQWKTIESKYNELISVEPTVPAEGVAQASS